MQEREIRERLGELMGEFAPPELVLAPPKRDKETRRRGDGAATGAGDDVIPSGTAESDAPRREDKDTKRGGDKERNPQSEIPNPKSAPSRGANSMVFRHATPEQQEDADRFEVPPHWIAPPEPAMPLVSLWTDNVDTLPVNWLWRGRLPMGRLVLLAGDPGIGKSFVALDIAARISTGAPWPDSPGCSRDPVNVLVFSIEDDARDTIAPRLKQAGAALDRVCLIEGIFRRPPIRGTDFKRRFRVPEDLPSLRKAILDLYPVKLVVFDPIMAYCGKGDGNGVSSIHAMLAPLAEMAMEMSVTVLCTIHLRQGAGSKAIYRMAGNPAFTTASRSVWGLVRDTHDAQRRLMVPVKMNLCPATDGLAFRIDGEGTVVWEQTPVKVEPDRLLSETTAARKLNEAVKWLREVLAAGSRPVREVKQLAGRRDISRTTLKRAKRLIGVKKIDADREAGRPCLWQLGEVEEQRRPDGEPGAGVRGQESGTRSQESGMRVQQAVDGPIHKN